MASVQPSLAMYSASSASFMPTERPGCRPSTTTKYIFVAFQPMAERGFLSYFARLEPALEVREESPFSHVLERDEYVFLGRGRAATRPLCRHEAGRIGRVH